MEHHIISHACGNQLKYSKKAMQGVSMISPSLCGLDPFIVKSVFKNIGNGKCRSGRKFVGSELECVLVAALYCTGNPRYSPLALIRQVMTRCHIMPYYAMYLERLPSVHYGVAQVMVECGRGSDEVPRVLPASGLVSSVKSCSFGRKSLIMSSASILLLGRRYAEQRE